MSIFGNIMSAIFEHASPMVSAASAIPPPSAAKPPAGQSDVISGQHAPGSTPHTGVDVSAIMDKLAKRRASSSTGESRSLI